MTVLVVTPVSITHAPGAEFVELSSPEVRTTGDVVISTAVDRVPVGDVVEIDVTPGPLLVRLSGVDMSPTPAVIVDVPDVSRITLSSLIGDPL